MAERLCNGNRTNSLRQNAEKTGSVVTDGGAKRHLQTNSEAKRNLIGWADNSQMNAEVTRKFSHEKKSLSRVCVCSVQSVY
ncbi:hypothetical protein T4E_1825 [Trichinella pseudospiralis]|uniref:Uncharacterized protein n=1 Tax=Trichinella pseudospiralis TaxID=6337 RepID=A0A0V0YF41_TRIPS|nr:hypothetical protein T4E_1825 [Trichinella pseudospiralis]